MGAVAGNTALGNLDLYIARGESASGGYDLISLMGKINLIPSISLITAKFCLTHESCGEPVDFASVDSNIQEALSAFGYVDEDQLKAVIAEKEYIQVKIS